MSVLENIRFQRTFGSAGIALGLLLTLRHIDGINGTTPIIIGLCLLAICSVVAVSIKYRYKFGFNYALLLFIAACAFSLVIERPEPLKYCWLRLAGFSIALAAFSPLISSRLFSSLRRGIWKGWWIGAVILTAASFMTLLTAVATSSTAEFHYFGFRGIMTMGMTLSPVAALTAIFALYRLQGEIPIRMKRIAWLALFCAGAITAVAAGSRIAVIGLIAGSAVILVFGWRDGRRKTVIGLLCALMAVGAVCLSVPSISNSIKHKTALAVEDGSPISSRQEKWKGRVTEFRIAPLTGVGFCAQTVFNSPYDNETEILDGKSPEPGSSWLSLPAQTGILGTGAFLAFLIPVIAKLLRKPRPLLSAVFVFLLLNGISEGWLLYSSALLFPLFWLSTSFAYE